MRMQAERGVALIATLLVMLVMSSLLVGFTTVVMSDQRFRGIDRDRTRAFYAAHSGLEKLTADLGALFERTPAPTPAQLNTVQAAPPVIPGIAFQTAQGTSGYTLQGSTPVVAPISSGPFQGLVALKTIYNLDSTARTSIGGEVHLTRQLETVAIPVFQFGIFSAVDLSFFAGPNFDFGGRVHTNGNLFLAEGAGNTLTLRSPVTAVRQIVRQRLSNGRIITTTNHTGTVSMATSTSAFRPLTQSPNEGSVVDDENSAPNPSWPSISMSLYNAWIRNGATGARSLNLPLTSVGGTNVELVRRSPANENISNPELYNSRYSSRVSLRVLLSDTAADLTSLPGVTATPPVPLDGSVPTTPPIARSTGPLPGPVMVTTNDTDDTDPVIRVDTVHPWFRPAPLTVGGHNVTCQGRTPNSFTDCAHTAGGPPPSVPAGTAVGANLNGRPAGTTVTLSTTLNGTFNLPVASTSGFAYDTFFLGENGQVPRVVTCSGNTNDQFTGCFGHPDTNDPRPVLTGALSQQNTPTIGGFIKIEMQNNVGVWQDVTAEMLGYGIGSRPQLHAGTNLANLCADPTPNAILRIQRLRDSSALCNYGNSANPYDYWPNVLHDPREGLRRDASLGANVALGGVMHYIALDAGNLSLWFQGLGPYAAGSGVNANNASGAGYSVYFSDRRNNRDASGGETGEYGFEDFVNSGGVGGAPNNSLDTGEDVNGNGALDTYGMFPKYNGVAGVPPGAQAPLDNNARPWTQLNRAEAQTNRAILFRRALKLVNGGYGMLVWPGLTIVSENPVYLQGDWNGTFGFPDANAVATSIIADAVTLLSNNWTDNISFTSPYSPGGRPRSAQSYYRVAIIAGKGPSFPWINGTNDDFGTDGGTHNFLRYLEGGGGTLNYRGSIVTFYFNRQAVGTYKCCNTVYSPPTRAYAFDMNFLDPALLPPLTPLFRDLNTLGFAQETRPGL